MIACKISSKLPLGGIFKSISAYSAVVVNPFLCKSRQQILIAEHLAKSSFRKKTNIARDFKLEFLLWLTGKRDIKSAMQAANPKGKEMFLILFNRNEKLKSRIINELTAKELKFSFAPSDPIKI